MKKVCVCDGTSTDNKPILGDVSDAKAHSEFQLYSAADVDASHGIERQKRVYWNTRILDFIKDLQTNVVTKFEVYGIIDVEWTRKKTSLLKAVADQMVTNLRKQDTDKTATTMSRISLSSEKTILQALERVEKSEIRLNSTYTRIEEMNKDKRKKHQLKKEEGNFDEAYTELKCQQSNLEKCLGRHQQCTEVMDKSESNNFPNTVSSFDPVLDQQEVHVMAEEIKKRLHSRQYMATRITCLF